MKLKPQKIIFSFLVFLGLFFSLGGVGLAVSENYTCTLSPDNCDKDLYCKPGNGDDTPNTCTKKPSTTTNTPTETKKSVEINFTPQIPFGDIITSDDIKAGAGIAKYTTNVYKYAVSIVGILAAIVLMWGGVRWLTAGGNQEAVGDAKKWIESALSGLVLVMTSYMILYFVNPDLTTFKLIKITPIESGVAPGAAGTGVTDVGATLSGFGKLPTCTTSDPSGCVTLDGLKPEIINELQWLKQNSNLSTTDLYITSGTEGSHNGGTYSHANGYKADLRKTTALTGYIDNNPGKFTKLPNLRDDKAVMYVNNATKNCYALEPSKGDQGPHWDISAAGRGCP